MSGFTVALFCIHSIPVYPYFLGSVLMANNDGVVYTKSWVVDLILDMAGYSTDKPLWSYKAIEPSCGEGSFLKAMATRVLETAERDGAVTVEGLKDCIRAYDLDANSVKLSRNAITAVLCEWGLADVDAVEIAQSWVRCEDYLFSENYEADFVVGNPPYVRATDLDNEQRKKWCRTFETMTMGCDLYVAFIERGLRDLRRDGKLCFICADRWLQNQYGSLLRGYVAKHHHIDAIVKMHDVDAFESQVAAYPAIILLDNGEGAIRYADCNGNFDEECTAELLSWLDSSGADHTCSTFEAGLLPSMSDNAVVPLVTPKNARKVLLLSKKFPALEEAGVHLGIGLATGRDAVFITDKEGIVEDSRMLPVFNMRDWRRGHREKQRWLINPWEKNGQLINLSDYPLTQAYFESNRESLEKRHIAKKNPDGWYRTIDKPKMELIGKPMLLFPDMASRAEPVYSDGSKYPCHNCYWITSDVWDLKVLGGLLMSEVAESFVDALGVKMRGGTLRFQAQYLRLIHIPPYEDITAETRADLSSAFERGDRFAATMAARRAYGF